MLNLESFDSTQERGEVIFGQDDEAISTPGSGMGCHHESKYVTHWQRSEEILSLDAPLGPADRLICDLL